NGIRKHGGIDLLRESDEAQTGLHAGPAVWHSGPRVVQSQLYLDHARVTFDEQIAAATFTPDKAALYDEQGVRGVVTRVDQVANSNGHSFDVYFRPFASGGYRLVIGPNITDLAGNPMNQNGNQVNGETPGDQYSAGDFVKPQVVSVAPSWLRFHVTFDKEIDPSTFTPAAVTLTDPNGDAVPVVRVSPVSRAGKRGVRNRGGPNAEIRFPPHHRGHGGRPHRQPAAGPVRAQLHRHHAAAGRGSRQRPGLVGHHGQLQRADGRQPLHA